MTSKKNIGITHVNHSATQKGNFDKSAQLYVQSGSLYFPFAFALGIIHGYRCDRKTLKTIILFK